MNRTEATAEHLCWQRHAPEWTAPRPRQGACDECTQITVLVLETYLGTFHEPTSEEIA